MSDLAFGVPDDDEMGCVGMGSLGEVEPYYPDPSLRGGYGGWPDSPQQNMDGTVVAAYAQKLRDVGYDAPITGNARDPDLMQQVAFFQEYKGLDVDGLLGPSTNAAIDREWAAMNAGPDPGYSPAPIIEPPAAPSPGEVPVSPAAYVEEGTSTGTWLVVGLIAAAVAGGAWYAWGR